MRLMERVCFALFWRVAASVEPRARSAVWRVLSTRRWLSAIRSIPFMRRLVCCIMGTVETFLLIHPSCPCTQAVDLQNSHLLSTYSQIHLLCEVDHFFGREKTCGPHHLLSSQHDCNVYCSFLHLVCLAVWFLWHNTNYSMVATTGWLGGGTGSLGSLS